MKRLLHELWQILLHTGEWYMVIPGDHFTEYHS
jgi:hypothetical protein